MIKWLGLMLVPAALLFAVACGDDDDDDDDDAAATEEATEAEADDDAAAGDLVEVEAVEFEFNYDDSAITTETTGFSFVNNGEQEHELVFGRIPEDFDIEAALADPEAPPPPEFEALGGTGAAAGEEGPPLEFTEPLTAGRYVMLCFVPDEETGQPHYQLGMISEFTVE